MKRRIFQVLGQSNAKIKVYKGNSAQQDVIDVPFNATGNVWHAFDITSNGIIMKNEFYTSSAHDVQ